jgi:membrane associated rhomboid family serine protease
MTQVPPAESTQPVAPVCYRHPKRATGVRCTRCDRPICPDCMNEASVGFQCPECVSEGRRTVRARRTLFGGSMAGFHAPVTITLIVINVLVELASLISKPSAAFGSGFYGLLGGGTPVTNDLALIGGAEYRGPGVHFVVPYGVSDGEYYRLFTAMFVHFGPTHLLLNVWGLWVIGRLVESELGPLRYAVLYLTAGLGSSVAAYLFTPGAFTAGASGALFGVFAALFVIFRRRRLDTSALLPLLVVNIVFSFAPGISLVGHVGGFIVGGVIAVVMAYTPRPRRALATSGAVAGLLILFAILVVAQTHAITTSTVALR